MATPSETTGRSEVALVVLLLPGTDWCWWCWCCWCCCCRGRIGGRKPAFRALKLLPSYYLLGVHRVFLTKLLTLREHLFKKRMFSFGHCPNYLLPPHFRQLVHLFWPSKINTYSVFFNSGRVPSLIRAMPERKHFFLREAFHKWYSLKDTG